MSIEIAQATDATMWWSVISTRLIIYGLLTLAVGISVIVIRFRCVAFKMSRKLTVCALTVSAILVGILSIGRTYRFIITKYPVIVYDAWNGYQANKSEILTERDAFDDLHVTRNGDTAPIVVVVLGESLRADHLGLNGYRRDTTPRLSGERNLVSFPHTYTDASYTTEAIPVLMTRSTSVKDDVGYTEPSFISVFKKAGYHTAWIANQSAEASYAYFAHESDTTIFRNAARPLNDYRKWLDSDLIEPYNSELAKYHSALLMVVQPIGSHWWYPSHYDRKYARFKPECTHKDIDRTGIEELINSYDNTVLATDDFIFNLIQGLRNKNAILIYMSDHGESLGENGLYLHGFDSDQVHHPASFVWYSDKYAEVFPDKVNSLVSHTADTISAGSLFYSVIDAANLTTDVLQPQLSIFR